MFAVKRYAGDARPCHRRHLRRRRTLKVSHHLGARGVRRFYPRPSGLANSDRRHVRDTSGLSVRDPDEGRLEGRARRLIGGSKTRGRCRRGFTR